MSFFRRRQPSVQVQDNQAAIVQQQQQQQMLLRQQQQQAAREREMRERELEREREQRERERERQAQQRAADPATRLQQQQEQQRQSPSQTIQPSSSQQGRATEAPDARDQPPPQQQQSSSSKPSQPSGSGPSRPAYPWSARRLAISPVANLSRSAGPPTASPPPFPRYGHSLPPIATASGDLFLFGGLVREQVKNDLYSFSVRDLSAALIETKGEIPPPRVGHASALVSSVLIVWGGDTKTSESDKQDDGLYLLNLGTREWTRVTTSGRGPVGRYGHAVTMVGTRFFVLGGQVDGEFMNDLWAFDLSSLKTPDPQWEQYTPVQGSDAPARRTGHVCITHGEKIYLFGGTDGQYHYNDTWVFDVPTRTWRELSCIGFIPVPREGHAATLVDDVMYVFGGRGVDGKDLGDLAAFKISNSRWYMFQNMGPAPSGRSGHAMAAAGSRVFVLGGESFTTPKPDDPSIIHVLDTRHIKYPDSNRGAPTTSSAGRRPSVAAPPSSSGSQQASPQSQQQPPPLSSSVSPPNSKGPLSNAKDGSPELSSRDRAMSPNSGRDRALSPTSTTRSGAMSPQQSIIQAQAPTRSISPPVNGLGSRATSPSAGKSGGSPNGIPSLAAGAVAITNGMTSTTPTPKVTQPPNRPKRDDDPVYGVRPDKERSEEGGSSTDGLRTSSPNTSVTPSNSTSTAVPTRAISPPNGVSRERDRDSPSLVAQQASRINGLSARSPSPSTTAPPPSDAFYHPSSYGPSKSPVGVNGFQSHSPRPSATNVSADLLRAKEVEIESMKRRETWMKAALAKATKGGFIWADGDLPESRVGTWLQDEDASESEVSESKTANVMKLKQEQAKIQSALAAQARIISDRLAEADRIRNGALQEAAFYRAKISAFENGSGSEVARLERERAAQLEAQVQTLLAERAINERKLDELAESSAMNVRLREQAEERANDATRRAEIVEEAHDTLRREHNELRDKHITAESSLRDHADRLVALSSSHQQTEAEYKASRTLIEELEATTDQHRHALDQARTVLDAASARTTEMDLQWQNAKKQVADLEVEVMELRNELENRIQEAEAATTRLTEVENLWAKSREEADAYRALTTGGLGKLLDTQKDMREDEDRATRGHSEKVRAMELESSSLRKMLKEAGTRIDAVQNDLAHHRDRSQAMEGDLMALRSQVTGLRSQLAVALADGGRLRKDLASRESELREKSKAAAEMEIRLGMLRTYLADNGLVIDEDELAQSSGSSGSRLQQLQAQVSQLKRGIEESELRLQDALRAKDDAESQLQMMSSDIDRLRSSSARSPSSAEDGLTRALAAERKLAETEAAHQEKVRQVEQDYQTAVHYVKGTEKMIQRMKQELAKQKNMNSTLQLELDSSRGVNGTVAGSRTRSANGRNTPLSEDEGTRAQLIEVQRKYSDLQLEHQALNNRLEDLQHEVQDLRDQLTSAQRMAEARLHQTDDLQAEVDRLESAFKLARGGGNDDLVRVAGENNALKAENKMLTDRINLLLDADHHGYDGPNPRDSTLSARRASQASSENAITYESFHNDMDEWPSHHGGSYGSHHQHNDFDSTPPRGSSTPTERRR